jgi:translocation and assembly module TamB
MAAAVDPAIDATAPPPRGREAARLLWRVVLAVVLLAAVLAGAVRWLDTDNGRAFLLRQLPRLQLQSGLTVRAGRIDGSIFGKAIIHDLRLGDPKGVFLTAPAIAIDWRPLDLVGNRLTIYDAQAGEIRVLRAPALRPTGDDRILPDIDIAIGRLAIDRLVLEPALAGSRRVIAVNGKADIRAGRALVKLVARTIAGAPASGEGGGEGGGDMVALNLDAEPDRDRFDLGAQITAPADGAIVRLLGLDSAIAVTLAGDGSWTKWRGTLAASLAGTPLARLQLSATAGQFAVSGTATPARLLTGVAARLAGPVLAIDATATVAGRHADVAARLASPALALDARGGLDFADESISHFTIDARLLQPGAIAARLRGTDVRLAARVAGSFKDPLVDYRLHAATAAWGTTVAQDLAIAGIVHAGARPLVVPATATAARLTGVGETAAPLLTQVRVAGPLTFAGGKVSAPRLDFRSARLTGSASLVATLGEDAYRIDAKAGLPGYRIEGLGLTDITAVVRVTPGAGGAQVAGTTTVAVTRLDNGFFRRLTGGLPTITADIGLDPRLALAFRNARLQSPGLALTVAGTRSPEGFVRLSGAGVSRDYGPLSLQLAGAITAPVVDLVLDRPGLGVGLAAIRAHLAPAAAGGWRFEAAGDSSYGDATAQGIIRSDLDPLAIDIADASLAGLRARGRIVQTAAGPFSGRIDMVGKGISATALLAAAGAVQRADVVATARDAELALATPVSIETGSLRLALLLPASGATATGNFSLAGIERDGLRIDKSAGSIAFANGRGTAKASASGSTDIPFDLNLDANLVPDRLAIDVSGTIDRRAIRLSGPAVFSRTDAGWRLAAVSVVTPDGSAEFSGLFGTRQALKATLDKVSLSLLTVAFPTLDFSGLVSGSIDLALAPGGVPSGTANLRLNGLSRAGIASASTPIDVGLNALLSANGTIAKAVIVRGGKVEGRAQLRVGPLPGGNGRLVDRLYESPLFGQLRYAGPAQAVWGLSGFEALDVRGAIAVAVDMGGVLGDPKLTGTVRTEGARLESTLVGAVIDETTLSARFTGSRLELTRFSGRVGKGGSISGSGGIDLSAERGFPIDIRLDVSKAQLINRDDYQASLTGRMRIATDIYGGVVSGKLDVDRAALRIGRRTAADVPVLTVNEINTRRLGRRVVAYARPQRWLLNLDINADRRIFVSGMGVESEWRARGKIKGGARTPELIGTVELVRGDYDFAGKRFALTAGTLRFQGGYPPDPTINVTAETTTSGFTAQLNITGSAGRPDIKFSSVPTLPEDEVLSRVLFGDSVTNLSAPEAVQLAGALASLRGGSGVLNPINLVRKGLGIDRLRILPADQTTGRKTAVAAGQYIGRNIYVELATDAQGYTATNIEVSLTRSLSVLSQVATLGGTSVSLRWKKDY